MQIYTNEYVFELHNLIKKLHKPLLHEKKFNYLFFPSFYSSKHVVNCQNESYKN